MNKPISKHALRRAMSKADTEGLIKIAEPIGAVVDRIWHDLEKTTYNGGSKKRPAARTAARAAEIPPVGDIEPT